MDIVRTKTWRVGDVTVTWVEADGQRIIVDTTPSPAPNEITQACTTFIEVLHEVERSSS